MYKDLESRREELEDMYYNKRLTTCEIGKIYGVNKSTISQNMKRMGFKMRQVGSDRANAKYSVDDRFFDCIDTQEKAYILGFFLADGHISKQGSLMFTIHKNDIDILKKINHELQSTYQIKIIKNNYADLVITSSLLVDSLKEIGFNHRKSYNFDFQKVLSNVPSYLYNHFIRGMFDGDGSIKYYKYDYMKKHQFHFGYTGLFDVVNFVCTYFNLHTKIVRETDLAYTCVSSCISDILRIKDILYYDAVIFMDRKFRTFNEIQHIAIKEFCNIL